MGLFDRFRRAPAERKESAASKVMVVNPGQPVWSPRNYESFAKEAYGKNVVAYQAINRIGDAVSSVKLGIYRGETELVEHPLAALLKRPNPLQSYGDYVRAKVGFLLIAGNGYEERFMVGREVKELYQLRPDRMKIIPANNGIPAAYEYTMNQQKVRWDMDPRTLTCDVRHLKLFNPLNDWYGMSPIEAGAFAIDQNNEAMNWMQALLQNSARPSGALTVKDGGTLSDENFNRLKAQIEEQYSGSGNAGRPMLLEGGLDWTQMGLSPTDMGIIEAKFASARDVALAFGVPPQLLGIPGDNTYCLPFEARVSTPDGPVKIGEIDVGQLVYSTDGNQLVEKRVTWAGKVGTKQTYRVRLTNRDIVATGNHPLLVRRDTGNGQCHLEYVPVDAIKPGDICVVSHALPEARQDSDITPHQMELYGFYTGDGSSALPVPQSAGRGYRRGGIVSLAIPRNASYLGHYATLLEKESGESAVLHYDRNIRTASSELARRLDFLGLTGTAHTKRVPAWVFKTSKILKLSYLRGFLDSDGSVDKNGRANFATCNLELIKDIWHLAISCGLRAGRIWSQDRYNALPNGEMFSGTMHGFMVSSPEDVATIGTRTPEYAAKISANLGKAKFDQHWYSTGGKAHSANVRALVDTDYVSYARVLEVVPEKVCDVYDIEVEDTHNFIADGVIVHNSNYQEARLAFWEDTALPLLDMIVTDWNAWLGSLYGVEIRPDIDSIPAIAEKRLRMWQMADASQDLTINERRALKGYGPARGGDSLFVSSAMIPLAMADDGDPGTADLGTTAPMGGSVQATALNGAQIASMVQIVQSVADGILPAESAIQMMLVAFPTMDEAEARAIITPASTFTPAVSPQDVKALAYGSSLT